MKLPYIKWYFRDASADLRLLDAVTRCVWYEMLWLMAGADRYGYLEWAGHPMTDAEVARAAGLLESEVASARPVLLASGIPSIEPETGAWFNRRMVADEAKRQACAEAGKRGGGSPLLASSPVATDLELEPITQNPYKAKGHLYRSPLKVESKGGAKAPKQELELPFPSEAFAVAWADWVQYRKETKHVLTPKSIEKQFTKMKGWGESRAIAALQYSIQQGYQGLFEESGRGGSGGGPNFSPKRPTQAGAPQALEGNSTIEGIHKHVPGGEGW